MLKKEVTGVRDREGETTPRMRTTTTKMTTTTITTTKLTKTKKKEI